MDVVWTKEQTVLVLRSVLRRLQKDPKSLPYVVERDGEVKICKRDRQEWISVSIYASGRGFMVMGEHMGGTPEPSGFFWQDKEYKQLIRSLRDFCSHPVITTDADMAILKQFPEMTDSEFEQHVLKPKS